MARAIWKYEFQVCDSEQVVDIPFLATTLTVAMQGDKLCLWALVNPTAETVKRTFKVHGTGHPVTAAESYVGTAFDRQFVWHLFEVHLG